jgi:hypothetical protein
MFQINVSENRKAIKNEQFRETGNIGYTRQRMKTDKHRFTIPNGQEYIDEVKLNIKFDTEH